MSSRNRKVTSLEALELILDHEDKEEDVSEDGDSTEVSSESDDSDYEPNDENAIHSPPNKTFPTKNGEIQWSLSPNRLEDSARAYKDGTDIKSAFELLMPNSIHPFSIFYLNPSAGAYPSSHWARGGVHPGQAASQSQDHTETNEKNNHARSLRTILETPTNLTCMFLDGGRKPEYPERTHAYTGKTCKLHTERPQVGIKPGTLSL